MEPESDSDRDFFTEAAEIIYRWLDERERKSIREEIESDGGDFDELTSKERCFFLLQFLETRYVRLGSRVAKTIALSSDLKRRTLNDVKEFRLSDPNEKSLTLENIRENVPTSEEMSKVFQDTLEEAGIDRDYKEFKKKRAGGKLTFE